MGILFISTGTRISGVTSGILPGFEFNYGLIPNGQLHIVAVTAFDRLAGNPTHFGYGDTEVGFKYRFIEEDKDGADRKSAYFRWSSCRPETKTVG